jgi:peptide/nickel transport system substrate-binding protein
MIDKHLTRRTVLGGAVVVAGGVVLAACTGDAEPGPNAGGGGKSGGLPPIEGGTVVTDRAMFPARLSESPEFAKLVAAGTLPPVAQRVGQDPLVIKPLQSIGKYGGELRRGFIGQGDHQNGRRFAAGPDTLLYWDYDFKKLVPNIARDFKISDDGKVLTLYLRRGMRWSDGQPFTADDVIFWREDINLNKELSLAGSTSLQTAGGPVLVRKVDDYTVEYVAPVPNPVLPRMMAGNPSTGLSSNSPVDEAQFAPKHYLSQFLPKYTSEAEANKKAQAAGAQTWALHVRALMDWALNPDLPVLTPWVVKQPINKAPWVLEANPYSIWVDTDGNQLPYIPKITMRDAGSPEVLKTQASSGSYDFQDRGLDLGGLPVLLQNQERGGYTVHHAPGSDIELLIRLNLSYDKDPVMGELLRDVNFRRALSLGINREEINKTFLLGTGTATASMVPDDSPYFPGPEWRTKWAAHDVAQANQLLDKIGLTNRDAEGFRLRPDKQRIRMDFDVNRTIADYPAISETVRQHWRDIGIDASVETIDVARGVQKAIANEVMVNTVGGFSTDVYLTRNNVVPTTNVFGGIMGLPYAKWLESGGKNGVRPPESLRLEEGYNLWREGLQTVDDNKRAEIAKQIYMLHADMVWSIGMVGFAFGLYSIYLAKNNLRNIPRRIKNLDFIRTPSNALPMTFYYAS